MESLTAELKHNYTRSVEWTMKVIWTTHSHAWTTVTNLVANMSGHSYAFLVVTIANNLPLPQAVNPSLVWNEAEFNTQLTLYSVFVVHNLQSEKMNIGVSNGNLISTYLKLWLECRLQVGRQLLATMWQDDMKSKLYFSAMNWRVIYVHCLF